MTISNATTEINGARITSPFKGVIQLDFVNRENNFQIWSHSFATSELNDLWDADKIQDQEERIKAIYNLISEQVDNYIETWEYENI